MLLNNAEELKDFKINKEFENTTNVSLEILTHIKWKAFEIPALKNTALEVIRYLMQLETPKIFFLQI